MGSIFFRKKDHTWGVGHSGPIWAFRLSNEINISHINVGSNLTRNCLVSIYLNFANFGQIIKAMVAFHRRCIIWILWVLYPHHIQLKVMKFQKFSAAGKLQYFHFPPSGRPLAPGARHLYKWRHTPLVKKSLPLLIWKRQSPLFMAQHNKRSQMK